MPFIIIQGDITNQHVDAIVNAANVYLQQGGGVCGAIFSAAGPRELQEACDRLSPIETGEAVITPGFALPAGYIVHTAGPVYRGGGHGEEDELRACYRNSLDAAFRNGCKSIAFPLISSGIFGYPKDEALSVATGEITDWLFSASSREDAEDGTPKADMDVRLVIYDKGTFEPPVELINEVRAFIDKHYDSGRGDKRFWQTVESKRLAVNAPPAGLFKLPGSKPDGDSLRDVSIPREPAASYDEYTGSSILESSIAELSCEEDPFRPRLDEPFSKTLLRLIDAKGKTDVEVYKRANLDRKLFSKIRKGEGYMPSKKTAVALAIALELTLEETDDLLERAGFALSRSLIFDVIVEFFITQRRFDIFEINEVLFEYDQPLLGV